MAELGMQYSSPRHQADTAVIGMWLFLATEMLFFGAILFSYLVYRITYPAGFAEAIRHTNLPIGSINTGLLLTSSVAMAAGVVQVEAGRVGRLRLACVATFLLGLGFLVLKGVEYKIDFDEHLVPGAGFAITGPAAGAAQIFFVFYYTVTLVHVAHLAIGLGLVGWIFRRAGRGDFRDGRTTPVEVVALYWSFVDIVWLFLYALIYLAGRDAALPVALPLAVACAVAIFVAVRLMRLGRGPRLSVVFAVSGVFWLLLMAGLGCTDYLTRITAPV